jgi:hypothetical protein
MLARPTPVDGEIAAAAFNEHLEMLWNNGTALENGWGRITQITRQTSRHLRLYRLMKECRSSPERGINSCPSTIWD